MTTASKSSLLQNLGSIQNLNLLSPHGSHRLQEFSAESPDSAKRFFEELKSQEEELASIPHGSQLTQRHIENSPNDLFFLQREKWIEAYNKLQFWSSLPGGPEYLARRLTPGAEEQVSIELEGWIQSRPDLLNLRSLTLSQRHITRLPSEIELLTQLEILEISHTPLRFLPPQIGALVQLKQFSLHHTPVRALPSEFQHLHRLEIVGLWHNRLENIDPLGSLNNLVQLSASVNKIKRLPLHLHWHKLRALNLSNNEISELPESFYQSFALTSLILHDNQIQALSTRVAQLSQLTLLCLNSNRLSLVPPSIINLPHLVSFNVANNQLSLLPPAICLMTSLQELTLKNNLIPNRPPFLPQSIWTDI